MPARPYSRLGIDQLSSLFDENRDNLDILKKLNEELQHRSTRKAVSLRASVEKSIKNISSSESGSSTTSSQEQHTAKTHQPAGSARTHETQEASTSYTASPTNHRKADESSSSENPHANAHTKSKTTSTSDQELSDLQADPQEFEHESDDQGRRDARKGCIRPRGKLSDVPEKRVFKLRDDLKLDISKDMPLIKRYEAVLKALITDMRKNKSSLRQIMLENGVSVMLDGRENGYQFPFNEEAELFEGAAVIAIVGGVQTEGRIISVMGRHILLSLADDFGPSISFCVIKVDNTAMLEALRVRFEKIINGDAAGFNVQLAEKVLQNIGDELPPAEMPVSIASELNPQQRRAIALSLSNEILYIWGPPGTGKTQTLSALCLALFEEEKRILICSNTNQAVDQVLLKLCKEFKNNTKGMRALDEGSVVRIGKIAHAELSDDWSSYVTLNGIVERKSSSLRERKTELEDQLDRLNKVFARAIEISKLFKDLDALLAKESNLSADYEEAVKAREKALRDRSSKLEELKSLEAEKSRHETAGTFRRTFLRKLETIERDIWYINIDIDKLSAKEESAMKLVQEVKLQLDSITEVIRRSQQALASFDRSAIEKQLEDAEEQKRPILDEITEINKQLDDIMKAVAENAKIIGATVTKAFLSPQYFTNFDTVIVDEASMVLLPALFHAAGLAKSKVVISGDFLQLAPIITTNQKAIMDEIGTDVFHAANVHSTKAGIKRRVMLSEQYRMDDRICRLISKILYDGLLKTGQREISIPTPPRPFEGTLTIIDTSPIWPFVNRDPFGSRFNLMNALAIRNLCLHFNESSYLTDSSLVGVCTPYAAQAKVMTRILSEAGLGDLVESGTVHRYQGDEKAVMVLDIPDSVGEPRVGVFLEAESAAENGALLFNVAVSRAKSHLIVFANLDYLDKKLPAYSILRDILFNMQKDGIVIDVRDVLSLYPIMNDLRKYGMPFDLSFETQKTGLFSQYDFDTVCLADMDRAQKGIAIFSGFVTPQRVAAYESLFRNKKAAGVTIRCVTRPPARNGSIPVDQGREALDGLEEMGCIVDTRGDIHEKVVIIDDNIVWFGSLNPLSHTSKTAEVMARIEGKQVAMQLASFLALNKSIKPDSSEGIAYQAENPRCPQCQSRASYKMGRFGPYWDCEAEACMWKESYDKPKNSGTGKSGTGDNIVCPKCGRPMVERMSRFGAFWGCSGYPKCDHVERQKRTSQQKRRNS